jgi:hypothetical protein
VGGKGGGTISDSLGGISDCQDFCSEPVSPGTTVGLTAKVAQGYSFGGWSGDCTGMALDTVVTMDAPKSCTATFVPNAYTLTVEVAGGVGGSIAYGTAAACTTSCSRVVHTDDGVRLVAQPQRGYMFVGWSGDCMGSQPEVALQVKGDIKCTATFAGPDGGGQCNTLANGGPVVHKVMVAQNPPPYMGGPLTPGTYFMTAATQYTGPGGAMGDTTDTIKETVAYLGSPASGPLAGVISVDGQPDVSFNATLTISGQPILMIDYQCGPLSAAKDLYTATPTELRVFDPTLQTEWVFTRVGPPPP